MSFSLLVTFPQKLMPDIYVISLKALISLFLSCPHHPPVLFPKQEENALSHIPNTHTLAAKSSHRTQFCLITCKQHSADSLGEGSYFLNRYWNPFPLLLAFHSDVMPGLQWPSCNHEVAHLRKRLRE